MLKKKSMSVILFGLFVSTVNTGGLTGLYSKSGLRDHCLERPSVLKDHRLLAEGPTFQWN